MVNNLAHQYRRHSSYPWVRKIPWRRKWQSTPVFLPGKSHQQGSLEDLSTRLQRAGHDWACTNAHSVLAVQLVEKTDLFSMVHSCFLLCHSLIGHNCLDLLLGWSIDSCISFCASTMQFWWSYLGIDSIVWSLGSLWLQLCCRCCCFPRIALTILGLL